LTKLPSWSTWEPEAATAGSPRRRSIQPGAGAGDLGAPLGSRIPQATSSSLSSPLAGRRRAGRRSCGCLRMFGPETDSRNHQRGERRHPSRFAPPQSHGRRRASLSAGGASLGEGLPGPSLRWLTCGRRSPTIPCMVCTGQPDPSSTAHLIRGPQGQLFNQGR
jgi:hypothetical protein